MPKAKEPKEAVDRGRVGTPGPTDAGDENLGTSTGGRGVGVTTGDIAQGYGSGGHIGGASAPPGKKRGV